jgi:hypothetical protein
MLYGPIHKCLRGALAGLSLHAGNTDYGNAASLAAVEAEFQDVLRMLHGHAKNEEDFIHPLYQRVELPFEELESKHRDFDLQIAEMGRLLEKIKTTPVDAPERPATCVQFYRRVNLFNSFYLAHLDEEEFRFLPMLMERMPHDQILEARARLQAHVPRDEWLLYLRYQIVTLNPEERVNALTEYRRVQPGAFGEMCRIAEEKLTPSEWQSLKARLPPT